MHPSSTSSSSSSPSSSSSSSSPSSWFTGKGPEFEELNYLFYIKKWEENPRGGFILEK